MVKETKDAVQITTEIPKMMNDEGYNMFAGKAEKIVEAFALRIRNLLIRRANACLELLQSHVKDVFYNNGFTIAWHRKDGTVGYFNVPTFDGMQRTIKTLEEERYSDFLHDFLAIDQTLKAICNDQEVNRMNAGEYTFANLVSLLMEIHAQPEPNFPQEP